MLVACGSFKQRLADLRAPGDLRADKQDRAHWGTCSPLISRSLATGDAADGLPPGLRI